MFPLATEAPADEQQDSEAPQPTTDYGEDNVDLPKQLVDAIRTAIVARQGEEKYTRRREVIRDRRNRFYESGHQHISWNNSQGGFAQASAGGLITNSEGQSVQCPTYIDDYNIFFAYLRVIMSVLTQNLPGVNFQPIDPTVPEDIDKARSAEDYSKAFDRYNDIKSIQTQIVRMMGLSGRTVSWTRTEEDGQKFGYNPDGSEKKFQKTTIYGTLETKCLLMCRDLDRGFPYMLIYDDPDVKVAKDEYPDFAEEIKPGETALDENNYERTARLGVLVGSRSRAQIGDSLTHLTGRVRAFLRPSEFTGDSYDQPLDGAEEGDINEDGSPMTLGEKLRQIFPDGVYACFVGKTYVASRPCSLDDEIEVQFPYEGDGFFRPAFMDSMIVIQDSFNDLCNWIREKVDTGASSTWIRATQTDVDAITSQKASPNAVRAAKDFAMPDRPLGDSFYREPEIELPQTLMELAETLRGKLPEFILAALPSLQGGEMSDNKTASGYAQANAQAKGQMGIIWSRIQRMFARIRYQSALAASKEDSQTGEMAIQGDNGAVTRVSMDTLKKGNFGCYPDEDSSFPESTAQKRSTFMNLLTMAGQSPVLMQMLDNPDNVEEAKILFGLDELVFIPAEARNKQLAEIEILLQQAPIPVDPEAAKAAMVQHAAAAVAAKAAGQPEPPFAAPQPQPSVPIQELDFHQYEYQKGQEWLSSAARRAEDARGNSHGVQNVILHTLAHRAAMMAMAAAMPPQPATAAAPHKPAGPPHPPAATQPPQAPSAGIQ